MEPQYTVLARRFRPQTFSEVVGQERVAQTLRNAINEGRVAHAYLFTGARGVGKTSMARIFAKALNCPYAKDGVPCNECEQCRGISVGQDVDVSEIDGASNRGIDDIRSLRANVNVKSMRSKYKIYIIDEVHMLTKEAFNALLKTLEEPPPMVKFVFCTTEPNKVPDTILSRCQRFDFGVISTDSIAVRLRQLAEAEGFQVDDAAVELVARRAAGSMRDSQSLFDQLLAFGSEQITAADVHRLLGTAPDDRLTDLVEALIERRRDEALSRLDAALSEGVQLDAFTDQLVNYLRDLMVTGCGAVDVPLLAVGSESRDALKRQSERWGLSTITTAMQILAEAKSRMQRVTYGRALAELALVRISQLEDLDGIDVLIAQLKSGQTGSISVSSISTNAPANRPAVTRPVIESSAVKSPQKKTELTADEPNVQVIEQSSVPNLQAGVSSVSPAPSPVIEWKDGCGNELQQAIVNRLNDMIGTSLRRAAPTAIVGPNLLEFSLPINYDVERRTLDRPETVARLEAIAAELVGKPIRIRFRMVEAVETVTKFVAATIASQRQQIIEDPEDPFLKEIATVFGVGSWAIKEVIIEAADENSAENAAE